MPQTNSQRVYETAAKAGKVSPGFLKLTDKVDGVNVSNGVHIVKFLSDEVIDKENKEGKIVGGMEYMFSENGLKVKYQVFAKNRNGELHYFIQRMAGFNVGDMVSLEFKKKEGSEYGYVDVKRPTGSAAKVPAITPEGTPLGIQTEEAEAKEEIIPPLPKPKDDIDVSGIPF